MKRKPRLLLGALLVGIALYWIAISAARGGLEPAPGITASQVSANETDPLSLHAPNGVAATVTNVASIGGTNGTFNLSDPTVIDERWKFSGNSLYIDGSQAWEIGLGIISGGHLAIGFGGAYDRTLRFGDGTGPAITYSNSAGPFFSGPWKFNNSSTAVTWTVSANLRVPYTGFLFSTNTDNFAYGMSLVAGANVTISTNAGEITIAASPPGSTNSLSQVLTVGNNAAGIAITNTGGLQLNASGNITFGSIGGAGIRDVAGTLRYDPYSGAFRNSASNYNFDVQAQLLTNGTWYADDFTITDDLTVNDDVAITDDLTADSGVFRDVQIGWRIKTTNTAFALHTPISTNTSLHTFTSNSMPLMAIGNTVTNTLTRRVHVHYNGRSILDAGEQTEVKLEEWSSGDTIKWFDQTIRNDSATTQTNRWTASAFIRPGFKVRLKTIVVGTPTETLTADSQRTTEL